MAPDMLVRLEGGDCLRARIFADLRERVHFSPFDPSGFDPRTASPEALRERALPPRPDAARLPRAFANWERLMSPKLEILPKRPVEQFFAVTMLFRPVFLLRLPAEQKVFAEPSRNWSGAVRLVPIRSACSAVHGSWTVPSPKPPPHTRNGGSWTDGTWFSSTWLGLDGYNAASVTLPQIGTRQIVAVQNGVPRPTAKAWWQWWLRDNELNRQIDLPLLAVQPDEEVAALVTVIDRLTVNLFLKNLATGQAASFDVAAPALPGSQPEQLELQTAEWVMERQTQPGGTDFLPFNDYGTCRFSDCGAVMDTGGVPSDIDLRDARLVAMTDWTDPLNPAWTVSVPEWDGSPAKFETRYVARPP